MIKGQELKILLAIGKTQALVMESFLMNKQERAAARRLVKKGLAFTGAYEFDARSTLYYLSSEGLALAEEMGAQWYASRMAS